MERSELVGLMRRLLHHVDHGTTDQAEGIYRVPVEAYRDPERWQREIDAIFRRVPLVVALTAHIPEPGSYRALDVAGVPVLSVRQADGGVRVFLNACRHRGALLCEPGRGKARRFTCPYHAWSYDGSGALVGIPGHATFGDLDTSDRGLTELACEERAGMIWAVATPGVELDLDAWLDGYDPVLEGLGLAKMHLYSENELVGPNWKVAYDGYVDGYHLDKLHRKTLGVTYMGNVMTADAWGPHQRVAFPQRSIEEIRGQDETQWDPVAHIGLVHTVFPHVSVAGGGGHYAMVSQLFPGPTPDRSRTIQTHLTPAEVTSDEGRAAMDAQLGVLEYVVREEDYKTGLGIQSTLESEANRDFVFGRNEPGNQRFHQWVDRLVTEAE